jgi:nucleoside-diphosphate-sugar epimerase
MTYVDNVALSIINAIYAEKSQGVFNITNGQPMRLLTMLGLLLDEVAPDTRIATLPYRVMSGVASVAEFCCGILPWRPEPKLTRYSAGLFHYDQSLCIDNAINRLGYKPAVSVEEGIRRYAQWYCEHEG